MRLQARFLQIAQISATVLAISALSVSLSACKMGKNKSSWEGDSNNGSRYKTLSDSEYKPILGPRLKVGSIIAHQVFQGPFGPTPDSTFAVYTENDTVFRSVIASGGKGYHSPPLGETSWAPDKITAVTFMDVDGDGADEAIVLARFMPSAGRDKTPFNSNAVLKWTGSALVRMPGAEKKIERLTTAAECRKALGG